MQQIEVPPELRPSVISRLITHVAFLEARNHELREALVYHRIAIRRQQDEARAARIANHNWRGHPQRRS